MTSPPKGKGDKVMTKDRPIFEVARYVGQLSRQVDDLQRELANLQRQRDVAVGVFDYLMECAAYLRERVALLESQLIAEGIMPVRGLVTTKPLPVTTAPCEDSRPDTTHCVVCGDSRRVGDAECWRCTPPWKEGTDG